MVQRLTRLSTHYSRSIICLMDEEIFWDLGLTLLTGASSAIVGSSCFSMNINRMLSPVQQNGDYGL